MDDTEIKILDDEDETPLILDGGLVCPQGKPTGQNYPEDWTFEDIALWNFYDMYLSMTAGKAIRMFGEIKDWSDWERLTDEMDMYIREQKAIRFAKKSNPTHAGHELGARSFSFTYSPKWGLDDKSARVKMELAIDRLLAYYKNELVEFYAVGEVGKNGMSHIHGYYELLGGRKITDKNFKRAWSYWDPKTKVGDGFKGGYHKLCERKSDYVGYMNEDLLWLKKCVVNKQNANEKEVCSQDETNPT